MKPNIVILSHRDDEHTLAVLSSLSMAAQPFLLDLAKTGSEFVVTRSPEGSIRLRTRNGTEVCFEDVKLWWNRRPIISGFGAVSSAYAHVQETELEEFWLGSLGYGFAGHWCNPFDAQKLAQNKVRQLHVAKSAGLSVPDTIWSNSPADVLEFMHRHEAGIVFKMFAGSKKVWQPCRRLDDRLIPFIDHLRFQPAIFQEFIGGDLEYRVTIFGDNCFVAQADLSKSRFPSDVRIDLGVKRTIASVDSATESGLRRFMYNLGLTYATFDLRERPGGELIFLECNPMGQFLYLDNIFKGGILRAFSSFFEGHLSSSKDDGSHNDPLSETNLHLDFRSEVTVPIYEAANSWSYHIPREEEL